MHGLDSVSWRDATSKIWAQVFVQDAFPQNRVLQRVNTAMAKPELAARHDLQDLFAVFRQLAQLFAVSAKPQPNSGECSIATFIWK